MAALNKRKHAQSLSIQRISLVALLCLLVLYLSIVMLSWQLLFTLPAIIFHVVHVLWAFAVACFLMIQTKRNGYQPLWVISSIALFSVGILDVFSYLFVSIIELPVETTTLSAASTLVFSLFMTAWATLERSGENKTQKYGFFWALWGIFVMLATIAIIVLHPYTDMLHLYSLGILATLAILFFGNTTQYKKRNKGALFLLFLVWLDFFYGMLSTLYPSLFLPLGFSKLFSAFAVLILLGLMLAKKGDAKE